MKRRDFLKTSALAATVAAGVTSSSASEAVVAETKVPTVQGYRELGKTGFKMSDISFGGGKLASASMILRAIDRGINYFDTAPDYGKSETYIGEAMPKIKRDKIFLTTKMCTPDPYPSHLPADKKKDDYIKAVEGSLSRLKTDYVDVIFVHAIGEMSKIKEEEEKRLLSEEMLAAVGALKKAGKVRFLAVSSHGPKNMEDLLMTAVKSGHFDIIMPSFNFMKFPKLPDVIKEAKNRGVGVVAMKTLAGAKDLDLDLKGESFEQAAFKWVLKHKEVNGLIVTMKTITDFDNYLPASGQAFTASDQTVLDLYAGRFGKEYCRTGCSLCEGSCSRGVDIASILRYQMYFNNYGLEKRAMTAYASLTNNAKACLNCTSGACTGACPHGLAVSDMLRQAHGDLIFTV